MTSFQLNCRHCTLSWLQNHLWRAAYKDQNLLCIFSRTRAVFPKQSTKYDKIRNSYTKIENVFDFQIAPEVRQLDPLFHCAN